GGLPVMSAGSIVGGVGVSGAPEPAIDDDCARAGIDAISDRLEF
ncbi:MAG: heme-binding protein, partial [Pseudomonadota bacterium]